MGALVCLLDFTDDNAAVYFVRCMRRADGRASALEGHKAIPLASAVSHGHLNVGNRAEFHKVVIESRASGLEANVPAEHLAVIGCGRGLRRMRRRTHLTRPMIFFILRNGAPKLLHILSKVLNSFCYRGCFSFNSMAADFPFEIGRRYALDVRTKTESSQKHVHTFKYDFQPQSSEFREGSVSVEGETVEVNYENAKFKGSKKTAPKEFVIVFDKKSSRLQINRLTESVSLKYVRPEKSRPVLSKQAEKIKDEPSNETPSSQKSARKAAVDEDAGVKRAKISPKKEAQGLKDDLAMSSSSESDSD